MNNQPSDAATGGGIARVVLLGVLAGALSGLFGVGGGILIVPALVLLLGMGQRAAHGTSLAAVVPIAVAGAAGFASDGKVDWAAAACMVVGGVVGAPIGSRLLNRISQRRLAWAFCGLLLLTGIRMLVDQSEADGRSELGVGGLLALVLLGMVAGVLAGLLGVGGGIVMVPGMVLGLGFTSAVARGTSLAAIVPTALAGTRRNLASGNTDLRTSMAVGLAGVLSSFAASRLSIGLSESASNTLFAVLLVLVALRMAYGNLNRRAV